VALSLAEIASALEAAVTDPPLTVSPVARLADLEALLRIETVARAAQAPRLADVDTSDATVEVCGRSTRDWLVEEQMLSPAEASRRMRLARGLPGAPVVWAAFAAGDITAEHALVILGALPRVVDPQLRVTVETSLVQVAKTGPPGVVAQGVDATLTLLGVEDTAAAAAQRRYAERGVGVDETFGGTGSLTGTLTVEVREQLRLALAAAGDKTGPDDDRSQRQRHHDALGEICGFYLGHAEELPAVTGERPRVIVTMSLQMLLGRLDNQWATLGTGVPIAPQTARRLACDSEFIPAVLGSRGELLDLGRSTKAFNTAIRRAAWLRDGGRCAFPRCRRAIVELHHIIWWSHGGHTSLDNAAWLCAFHHWLVHEGRWTMRRDPDGGYTFRSPDGRQRSSPPPRQPEAA
jgi:hypothetical protein